MSTFKTHIEIEVVVDYDYQPYEPQSKDCPETYAEVTVNVVEVVLPKGSVGFGDIQPYLDKSTMESITEQCFEQEQTRNKRV